MMVGRGDSIAIGARRLELRCAFDECHGPVGWEGKKATSLGALAIALLLSASCGGDNGGSGSGNNNGNGTSNGTGSQTQVVVPPNTCAVAKRMALTAAPGTSLDPALVRDGDAFLVVWSDERNGKAEIFMTFVHPDGSRARGSGDTLAASGALPAYNPRVSPLGNARYLLVWQNCAGGALECPGGASVGRAVVNGAGQAQAPVGELTGLAVVQRRPHVTTVSGRSYVAYRDLVGTTTVVRVVPVDEDGNPASPGATFGDGSAGMYPFITSGDGRLALIYSRGGGQTEIVFDLLEPDLGVARELVVRQGTRQATNPVAAWNGGGWTLAWEDEESGEVLVESTVTPADAASVGVVRPLQADNSNWPALASDGQNTVIAYYGFPDSAQVMVARVDRGGQQVGTPIQVSASGGRARFPSVAYSGKSDDGFGTVWQDEKSGEIVYAQVVCR